MEDPLIWPKILQIRYEREKEKKREYKRNYRAKKKRERILKNQSSGQQFNNLQNEGSMESEDDKESNRKSTEDDVEFKSRVQNSEDSADRSKPLRKNSITRAVPVPRNDATVSPHQATLPQLVPTERNDWKDLIPQLAKAVAEELARSKVHEGLTSNSLGGNQGGQYAVPSLHPVYPGLIAGASPTIVAHYIYPQTVGPDTLPRQEFLGKRTHSEFADREPQVSLDFLKDPDFIMDLYHLSTRKKAHHRSEGPGPNFNRFSYELSEEVNKSKDVQRFLSKLYRGTELSREVHQPELNRTDRGREVSANARSPLPSFKNPAAVNPVSKLSFQNKYGPMLDSIKGVGPVPADEFRDITLMQRDSSTFQHHGHHTHVGDPWTGPKRLPDLPKFMETNLGMQGGSVLNHSAYQK